jgi:hypothetical protein
MPSEDPLKGRSWYYRYTGFGKQFVITVMYVWISVLIFVREAA